MNMSAITKLGVLSIDGVPRSCKIRNITRTFGENPLVEVELISLDHAPWEKKNPYIKKPGADIKKVIFNDPATIVIWSDDSKTVVKCQPNDTYNKETGLAMCIAKKYLGNKGNFNEVFKKWIHKETEPVEEDAKIGDIKVGDIKVGDTVRVIESGCRYPSYAEWIKRNVTNPTDATKWDPDTRLLYGDIGVVKYLAPHGLQGTDIAYIEIKNKCHMIGVEGIEKV